MKETIKIENTDLIDLWKQYTELLRTGVKKKANTTLQNFIDKLKQLDKKTIMEFSDHACMSYNDGKLLLLDGIIIERKGLIIQL